MKLRIIQDLRNTLTYLTNTHIKRWTNTMDNGANVQLFHYRVSLFLHHSSIYVIIANKSTT